jgi:CRP-like cAMP-binding protein
VADPGTVVHPSGNALLDRIPPEVRDTLVESSRFFPLMEGEILHEAGEPIKAVYFPTKGIISVVTVMADGTAVEAGTIGREGVAGISAALGREAPGNLRAMAQISGESLEVDAEAFRKALESSHELHDLIQSYIQAVWAETAQTVACNRLHSVGERCARWLLLTAARVGQLEFRLTQEFLAVMLGIRRPSVSIAAEAMRKQGLISYHRGQIKILDREGLERSSCECYEVIRREFELVLPGALPAPRT